VCGESFVGTTRRVYCAPACATHAYWDRHRSSLNERRRKAPRPNERPPVTPTPLKRVPARVEARYSIANAEAVRFGIDLIRAHRAELRHSSVTVINAARRTLDSDRLPIALPQAV